MASNVLDHVSEVGWTRKLYLVERVLVSGEHSGHTVDLRIANVTMKREAVRCPSASAVARYISTVAIQVYLVIAIVVLKNFTDILDCIEILVSILIKVV